MTRSVYDAMLQDVEIITRPRGASLGNPAMAVDQAPEDAAVEYTQDKYNNADRINVGVGGLFAVPASSTAQIISNPFRTQKVTIPSSVAEFLLLDQITIGSVNLIDGDPICADIFSEVSLNNQVNWPTAQTGQQFRITVTNADAAPHQPRITLSGIRLRA
jgi:hypothetical protein